MSQSPFLLAKLFDFQMKNNLFKFIDLDNFKDIIKLKRKILFSKICFERDDIMKKRIAVISVMMENAKEHQVEFNNIVANFQQYIYGRKFATILLNST